jgi:hypothetical protein
MRQIVKWGLLLAVLGGGLALAGDAQPKMRKNEDRIKIPGTFVSIGETLAKLGANAQDSLHTRGALGLLAKDGALWSFVDNAKGHGVITNPKWKGKATRIFGWRFPKTRFIEISKFEIQDGGTWVAYDYCKSCGWEPGDNHDRDLCDDCAEAEK